MLVFVFKASVLDKPIWWGERAYVEGAVRVYQNNLNPFVEFWSYKPPLLFVIVALGYKIFGTSTAVPHFIIALFAVIALYLTFLLGKKMYSKEAGFFASLLLFFSATFFMQSESFVAAVPVAALTLSTIYFYFINKKWGYFISATLLVLTKEPTILVVIAIALYEFIINIYSPFMLSKNTKYSQNIKKIALKILFILSPLSFFLAWLVINKILLGWFLWSSNANFFKDITFTGWGLKWILHMSFWDGFRFIITIAILMSCFKSNIWKQLIKKEFLLFLILIAITVIFHWAQCEKNQEIFDGVRFYPLPRYYLYLQPLFFIVGAEAIIGLLKKKTLYFIAFVGIILLFINSWFSPFVNVNGENDLNQRYMIIAHKEAAEFLQEKYSDALIILENDSDEQEELASVPMGYVKAPLRVIGFAPSSLKYLTAKERVLAVTYEWIYKSKNSTSRNDRFRKYLRIAEQKNKANVIAVFEKGPERVTIYNLR